MESAMPIVLLTVVLNYNLFYCDLNTIDNFNETLLMRRHRERMNMVNVFFQDLKRVLNNDRSAALFSLNKRKGKGIQETTHPNLRVGSIANTFYSTQSAPTKSTLKLHKLPDYVNKPFFPIPIGTLSRTVMNVSGKPSTKPSPTTKTTFYYANTTKIKPSTVTLKPTNRVYVSPSTATSISTNFVNKLFPNVSFQTYYTLKPFAFRSVNSSNQLTSKALVSLSISSSTLTTPKTSPSVVTSTILPSRRISAVKFNQFYNLKAEIDNFSTTGSTLSYLRAASIAPTIFNNVSAFIPKHLFDKSLPPTLKSTLRPNPTSTANFEITTVSSPPKAIRDSVSLALLSTFDDKQFSKSYPKSSSLKFKIPSRESWSYRSSTDKYVKLWQQEMANFTSSHRWEIKGNDFTTQRISSPRYPNVVQSKPISHHGRNQTNHTRLNRQKRIRHKKMWQKRKRGYAKYQTTKQYNSFIKHSYGYINAETTDNYEHSTFKTTIIDGRHVYLPLDPAEAITPDLIPTASTKSPNLRYYEMMKAIDEGFMMIFLIELSRIISVKDEKQVKAVIVHTATIVHELYGNERLVWLGSPLLDITVKLSRFISEAPIDLVRSYAAVMYHMLRERKQALSVEVNSIIDSADLLYNDEEGEYLFNSLREFEAFPEISKSGYLLCSSLVESLLHPFRRLHNSDRRQKLLDSINKAIRDRFPLIALKKTKRKSLNFGLKETSFGSYESFVSTSDSDSEIRRKLHLKRKQRKRRVRTLRKRAKHRNMRKLYRRLFKYNATQRRYKVVTSKYHLKPARDLTTKSYTFNLRRRPTKEFPLKIARYLNTRFPYFHEQEDYFDTKSSKAYQRAGNKKRRQRHSKETIDFKILKEIYNPFDAYFRKSEPLKGVSKITNAYLKRIVEASSYSDEEESLKMKLNGALFNNGTSTKGTTK